MKRKELKIYSHVGSLISEAMRRILHLCEYKILDYEFAGLGSPSQYRDGVTAGFFAPSFHPEIKRVNNWYKLTPLGQKVVKQMIRKGRVPKSCHDLHNYVPFKVTVYIEE
jgi:hypothetical protein